MGMTQHESQTAPPIVYPRMEQSASTALIYKGLGNDGWRDTYHALLTMPVAAFIGVMAGAFLAVNLLFATLYHLDPTGLAGARPGSFADDFFFSVQTLGTLGYGAIAPRSLYANLLVTVEIFVGLFQLAIATGLMFARVSRPTARIMFSDVAVVTDFDGCPTLMFRAANRRRNRIVEAEVSVSVVMDQVSSEGHRMRSFRDLAVMRPRTPLFILSWQVMHRIDEASPLHGHTAQSLAAQFAEIIVVMRGLDETFSSTIHARASYAPHEIIWNRRLKDIFSRDETGRRVIDFTHFHAVE
ncbi:MAG: ATP-sensitive inward rectifier potassium channel 10 [Proteobacteria bacterium]|nr:ATP-sensitive inward rectifier potassium channel 10 [Pseudomonadota bacterium]